jgi:single-stranded-DNA-specific exonuclease
VSLKLAQALLESHPSRDEVVRSLMKLAAIGTVADVVDLSTPENRAIVTIGLEALSRGPNSPGLDALLSIAGCMGRTITAGDCGFRLGPRINAAGRIEHAKLAVDLLLERDPTQAARLAHDVEALNQARKQLQETLVRRVLDDLPDPIPAFPLFGGSVQDGWHKGLSGIVASKIKEALHRPVGVFAVGPDGFATASVRSIPAIHAVHALQSAEGLLERFGGHPFAAGFTARDNQISALQEQLSTFASTRAAGLGQAPDRTYDVTTPIDSLDLALAHTLERLGPFGKGNPAPLLRVPGVRSSGLRTLNNRHLRFELRPGVSAIWWRAAEHRAALADGQLDLIGRLEINHWRGKTSAQLVVEDAIVHPAA